MQRLPLLLCLLDILAAAFGSLDNNAAAAAAPDVSHMSTSLALSLLPALVQLLASLPTILSNHSPPLPAEAHVVVVGALIRLAAQEAVRRHTLHTQWSTWLSSLQSHAHAVPLVRTVLGDALVAAGLAHMPREAEQHFLLRTLHPVCNFLLTPPQSMPGSGLSSGSALASSLESHALSSFFRFTAVAHVASWVSEFKELIPLLVRPKVVAFVKRASEAQQGQNGMGDVVAALFGRDARRETIGAVKAGSMPEAAANAATAGVNAANGSLAQHLHAEAVRLNEQCAQEAAQLQSDPVVNAHRVALMSSAMPALEFASSILLPPVAHEPHTGNDVAMQ
jgi:hypothetical protein